MSALVFGIVSLSLQFGLGAIVSHAARKDAESFILGKILTFALGVAAIVEQFVILVPTDRINELFPLIIIFDLLVCALFLFVNLTGYALAFAITWRLGLGRGQVNIATLLALTAIFASAGAIARASRQVQDDRQRSALRIEEEVMPGR